MKYLLNILLTELIIVIGCGIVVIIAYIPILLKGLEIAKSFLG